ncbi:DNA-binding transcriptional regulator, LysR family [Solimonas aquatica]|uniref:DNA-binding transcriptional regulator, LysR family n=1 Tax=Solimonas aquatica TaxID=489703 RepID=A0A1H9LQY7_9GAMM|nr:LysR family transcriptional regulator [Solimonas aquatica]SER13669.1 DNA-binding transcriptional regulator, LysR family [Solimonas aquatica]
MSDQPRISLEQWRALTAVVEAGGYAQAAERLHKTQSTLSYAVQKIERLLGLKVFAIEGRKAKLTRDGEILYRRAQILLAEAAQLEHGAAQMAAGWEAELRIAAEIVFPTWLLLQSFSRYAQEQPQTRIQLYETVLGGTDEALLTRQVDLAITGNVPQGFIGEALMRVRFVPAAHPGHPLHQLGRELSFRDLRAHRQLVIRDSAQNRPRESGAWLGAAQRLTVSHKATSIAAAKMGLGFAWFAEDTIREELASGELKRLPMREGLERYLELYLVFADRDYPGRGAWRLGEIIRELLAQQCPSRSAP